LERQKDDPYYISDKKPPTDDVDNIPVVKLEGVPSPVAEGKFRSLSYVYSHLIISTGGHGSRFVGFKPRSVTSQVAVVDVAGEMPTPRSGLGTPLSGPAGSTSPASSFRPAAPIISSFPQYEVEDEPRATTPVPEPIKVTKVKKKKVRSTLESFAGD
jgi:hypothetical protein